ncbi:Inner membrane protein yedI [Aggregatibacter aphrophilus]|uniref:Inner membrane protein yedI n=1 Tax=Aggregatibacter aphrophilus TaxID=732 RepID=A0A336NEI9_AGGAP|nr:Inner membrane protein yedI [Aggregatibacter aphrophilus]
MAFSSLFTLLDDIASLLDDVSVMTKVAAKKTVGVVGDDLALNANQVTGATAERELPIVWAVTKGSLVNKIILIPIALLLSAFLPALIVPLLMIGGAYLCFEGVEKFCTNSFLLTTTNPMKKTNLLMKRPKLKVPFVPISFFLPKSLLLL